MAIGKLGGGMGRLGRFQGALNPPPGYVFRLDWDGAIRLNSDGTPEIERA